MRRDRTLRQLRDRIFAVRLFDECPAHDDASRSFRSVTPGRRDGNFPHIGGRCGRTRWRAAAALPWNLFARKKFSLIERRCQRVLVLDGVDLTAPIQWEYM